MLAVGVGRDSKQDRARHSKGGRRRDRKTRQHKTNKQTKKKLKKNVCFINGSLLIGKIQSFPASHALRNLALR